MLPTGWCCFVPLAHVVAQIYPNSSLWDAYGLAPVEELILMIDPLVESDEDGLYRVRTYTPENVCPFSRLVPPYTLSFPVILRDNPGAC